jgi:uncharacterized membrane protein YecN with MAPEG domain
VPRRKKKALPSIGAGVGRHCGTRIERNAMTAAPPLLSSVYAAIFGLLAALLTVRVIMGRVRTGIQSGDGGDASLGQAIRAHANFAEQVPLALLLIVLVETTGAAPVAVHIFGIVLIVARSINAWGLSHSLGPTTPRQAGAALTILVVAAASLLLVYRAIVFFAYR